MAFIASKEEKLYFVLTAHRTAPDTSAAARAGAHGEDLSFPDSATRPCTDYDLIHKAQTERVFGFKMNHFSSGFKMCRNDATFSVTTQR